MTFSLFPSFFDRPQKMSFADQEDDEHIELLLRQHWITNVPWIFIAALGFLVPVFLVNQKTFIDFIRIWNFPYEILIALFSLWYMFILAYVIGKLLYWYFNIYIVTNTHLVDITLQNLLSRNITEVRLDDVQSASSQVKGIIGSLFNFGDLTIETAAERQQIYFRSVPRPDFAKERIQDLQELQEHGGTDVG